MSASLNGFLGKFRQAKILVIGDLILDEFVWGKVDRISPEAPVPVVWVQSESLMPGGAANVANNLSALKGQVSVLGVIGADPWGERLLGELGARGIDAQGVIRVNRPTTVKTRVIAHHQQMVRVDREHLEPHEESTMARLIDAALKHIRQVDAVIIEDYGKGVITRRLLEAVVPAARKLRKVITVDPKEDHFDLYRGVTALTPNRSEAGAAVGRELKTNEDVEQAGKQIVRRLQCESALITLGEDGMWLFERSGRQARIPTVAQEVFDVAGAGDTVIAAFTLALATNASVEQAARLANYAAGIVVGKLGVAVATPEELIKRLSSAALKRPATRSRPVARTSRQP